MKGFEVIFIAARSRVPHDTPVLDTIVEIAWAQGIQHSSRRTDAEVTRHSAHTYSAHFFGEMDEAEELMFVLDGGAADALIRNVEEQALEVFCLRRAVDYWRFGEQE